MIREAERALPLLDALPASSHRRPLHTAEPARHMPQANLFGHFVSRVVHLPVGDTEYLWSIESLGRRVW